MNSIPAYIIYTFWRPYFKISRLILLMPILALSYSGMLLTTFTLSQEDDLEVVSGTYQTPILGRNKTDSYNTKIITDNNEVLTCNCDPGGRGNPNCLNENKAENKRMIQQLNGARVVILMARKRAYEYNRVCYEIRVDSSPIVSYWTLYNRYKAHKQNFNFDVIVFQLTLVAFILTTSYKSYKFMKDK